MLPYSLRATWQTLVIGSRTPQTLIIHKHRGLGFEIAVKAAESRDYQQRGQLPLKAISSLVVYKITFPQE